MQRSFARLQLVTLLLAAAIGTRSGLAQSVPEIDDAGQVPATAQPATGVSVQTISGELTDDWDIDLFRITIDDHENFSATTTPGPGTVVDSRLYLFDANGYPVYMNDDDPNDPVSNLSLLAAGHPFGPQTDGDYILGISTYFAIPLGSDNEKLFTEPDDSTSPDYTVMNGPASSMMLTAWDISNIQTPGGTYTITVSGVNGALAVLDADMQAVLSGRSVTLSWNSMPSVRNLRLEQTAKSRIAWTSVPLQDAGHVVGGRHQVVINDLDPAWYSFRLAGYRADGTPLTLGEVDLLVPANNGFIVSDAFPNPASSSAFLTIASDAENVVEVELFDLNGRRLRQERVTLTAHSNSRYSIVRAGLASGVYVLRIRSARFNSSRLVTFVD